MNHVVSRLMKRWCLIALRQEILSVIRNAKEANEEQMESFKSFLEKQEEKHRKRHPLEHKAIDTATSLLWCYVQSFCLKEGFSYHVLTSHAELRDLVTSVFKGSRTGVDGENIRVLGGWRKTVLGNDLIAVLKGEKSLTWDPSHSSISLMDASAATGMGELVAGGVS